MVKNICQICQSRSKKHVCQPNFIFCEYYAGQQTVKCKTCGKMMNSKNRNRHNCQKQIIIVKSAENKLKANQMIQLEYEVVVWSFARIIFAISLFFESYEPIPESWMNWMDGEKYLLSSKLYLGEQYPILSKEVIKGPIDAQISHFFGLPYVCLSSLTIYFNIFYTQFCVDGKKSYEYVEKQRIRQHQPYCYHYAKQFLTQQSSQFGIEVVGENILHQYQMDLFHIRKHGYRRLAFFRRNMWLIVRQQLKINFNSIPSRQYQCIINNKIEFACQIVQQPDNLLLKKRLNFYDQRIVIPKRDSSLMRRLKQKHTSRQDLDFYWNIEKRLQQAGEQQFVLVCIDAALLKMQLFVSPIMAKNYLQNNTILLHGCKYKLSNNPTSNFLLDLHSQSYVDFVKKNKKIISKEKMYQEFQKQRQIPGRRNQLIEIANQTIKNELSRKKLDISKQIAIKNQQIKKKFAKFKSQQWPGKYSRNIKASQSPFICKIIAQQQAAIMLQARNNIILNILSLRGLNVKGKQEYAIEIYKMWIQNQQIRNQQINIKKKIGYSFQQSEQYLSSILIQQNEMQTRNQIILSALKRRYDNFQEFYLQKCQKIRHVGYVQDNKYVVETKKGSRLTYNFNPDMIKDDSTSKFAWKRWQQLYSKKCYSITKPIPDESIRILFYRLNKIEKYFAAKEMQQEQSNCTRQINQN